MEMMTIILAVVGTRTFKDYELMKKEIEIINPTRIVTGDARGADSLAVRYAEEKGIPYRVFEADWSGEGKKAGMLRNKLVVDACTDGLVFWDQRSPGTGNAIENLRNMGRPYKVIEFTPNSVKHQSNK